jgi:hypothetical protein
LQSLHHLSDLVGAGVHVGELLEHIENDIDWNRLLVIHAGSAPNLLLHRIDSF